MRNLLSLWQENQSLFNGSLFIIQAFLFGTSLKCKDIVVGAIWVILFVMSVLDMFMGVIDA